MKAHAKANQKKRLIDDDDFTPRSAQIEGRSGSVVSRSARDNERHHRRLQMTPEGTERQMHQHRAQAAPSAAT
eukprot:10282572-Ditylum_brightwellii.AAC.1